MKTLSSRMPLEIPDQLRELLANVETEEQWFEIIAILEDYGFQLVALNSHGN